MRNQGQAAELKSINMPRNRLLYAGFSALTLVCGLATRPLHSVISPELAKNLGDALLGCCHDVGR